MQRPSEFDDVSEEVPYPGGVGRFTRGELNLILVIISFTAIIVWPVFARARAANNRYSGAYHLHQIGLALLAYSQDNDGRFPPGRGYALPEGPYNTVRRWNNPVSTRWGPDRTLPNGQVVPGLLAPYRKTQDYFAGVPVKQKNASGGYSWKRLGYMYNDLAATQPQADFSGAAQTVLVTEGEDVADNVGHAWLPEEGPYSAAFNKSGLCDPGNGATVRDAPTRLNGGANYLFADGHTQWLKGMDRIPPVYFPAWESAEPAAPPSEPKPGGDMKGRVATFRVR